MVRCLRTRTLESDGPQSVLLNLCYPGVFINGTEQQKLSPRVTMKMIILNGAKFHHKILLFII